MANRRMFSKEVVGSDMFLDLPVSSRELYFHLGMYADDDGFVSPKKVIRMVGASDDDIKILVAKGLVIPFESGVIVIRHWKQNNYIQSDRYSPTLYQTEFRIACEDNVYNLDTQYSIGKNRLGKNTLTENKKVFGNDIELLSKYFISLKGNGERPSRYYRSAADVLNLCNNSLEAAKKQVDKTKAWAAAENLEWEMETVVKKYLELQP